jgi:sulfite reductase (NADPH) flavoprotein alpha-component
VAELKRGRAGRRRGVPGQLEPAEWMRVAGLAWALGWMLLLWAAAAPAAERHSDPDGCFSCHGLPGLEFIDREGVRRTATILQADYYGSLHGSVPCKDCHRQIERYPHKPEEGYVDCSESCHVEEPSKGKPFTHKEVVEEFKTSAHGSGHAPGATKGFHGGNRLKEQAEEQNPSCRRCHSNTPYIKDSQMARFQEEFHHTETECGTCHQGKTWMNQFSGHVLRRLVGKNYNKLEANAMCVDCHGDAEAMQKVKIEDPATKAKKPVDARFVHATQSYGKTLHGRFLAVGDESGAACLDCHATEGFRHGIRRDEDRIASTHPEKLAATCGQAGCHGYARHRLNEGFVKTDLHDVDMLRLDLIPLAADFGKLDSNYARAAWLLGPLALLFGLGSLLWNLLSPWWKGNAALVGHEHFNRVMLEAPRTEPGLLDRLRAWLRPPASDPDGVPEAAEDGAIVPSMSLLYASQTGNGQGIAEDLATLAEASGFRLELTDMAEYDPAALVHERLVFVICSTHGDGEPPPPAERLHAWLKREDGPKLPNLRYAVLALGDSSYKQFCKAGKDFDAFLEKRGASRLFERVDADADFDEPAAAWCDRVLDAYSAIFGVPRPVLPTPASRAEAAEGWSKANPYPARIAVNRVLNGEGSAKETRHIEIDLGDSGLVYEAGDALGVYPKNNPVYVEALLAALRFDGYAEVTLGRETLTLREAFYSRLDITALSRPLLEKYADLAESTELDGLLKEGNEAAFGDYTWGRHILDLVEDHPPAGATPQGFVDVLRRLPARLYSIASSLKAVPGQVHLCVGAVRYTSHGRDREGVCSTFLAERLGRDERLGIFVQPNKGFRPPADGSVPMIMVGPGTCIAPFRSFLQEREAAGSTGRNWLFFGDQRQATDFLYAEEWEERLKRGLLTRLDLAFSRDQAEKIYVQTRMLQQAKDLYAWLEEGAAFYVCGDASRMAHDVHAALARVVAEQGGMSPEKAEEYLKRMADEKRYQRDVY